MLPRQQAPPGMPISAASFALAAKPGARARRDYLRAEASDRPLKGLTQRDIDRNRTFPRAPAYRRGNIDANWAEAGLVAQSETCPQPDIPEMRG